MLHIKFQASEPRGSEEENFSIFLCISMVRTYDPWRCHLGPWVKDHQDMLHNEKFQAPEPSNSGEEDFSVYFNFEPKTLCIRATLDPRATI